MPTNESWKNVGRRIRRLRKTQGLTIKQLALGCDLSPNAISLVERGAVAPTVITLCKIASALGVSASSFLQDICPNEVVLVRAGDGDLAQPVQQLGRFLSLDDVQPGAPPAAVCQIHPQLCDASSLYSQQTVMCLCGAIEYEDNDGRAYLLEPGDQLTCNGNAPHRWRSHSQQTAVAVLVMSGASENPSDPSV